MQQNKCSDVTFLFFFLFFCFLFFRFQGKARNVDIISSCKLGLLERVFLIKILRDIEAKCVCPCTLRICQYNNLLNKAKVWKHHASLQHPDYICSLKSAFLYPTPWRSQFVNCKLYSCDMDLPASLSLECRFYRTFCTPYGFLMQPVILNK